MNRKQRRKAGMEQYAVSVVVYKQDNGVDDVALVGVGDKPEKNPFSTFVFQTAALSPTDAMGMVCHNLWRHAAQNEAMAMIVGCAAIKWTEYEKNMTAPKQATEEEKEKKEIAPVIPLEKVDSVKQESKIEE